MSPKNEIISARNPDLALRIQLVTGLDEEQASQFVRMVGQCPVGHGGMEVETVGETYTNRPAARESIDALLNDASSLIEIDGLAPDRAVLMSLGALARRDPNSRQPLFKPLIGSELVDIKRLKMQALQSSYQPKAEVKKK